MGLPLSDAKPDLLWHYSSREALNGMLYHDFIRANSIPPWARAAVWFSTEAAWEPTAFNFTRTSDIRIGVVKDTAPYSWLDFMAMSGIDESFAEGLASSGIQRGADPSHWFVSFCDVSRTKWVCVQERISPAADWSSLALPRRLSQIHFSYRRIRDPIVERAKQVWSKYTMSDYHRSIPYSKDS